jgi:hypothetical protein
MTAGFKQLLPSLTICLYIYYDISVVDLDPVGSELLAGSGSGKNLPNPAALDPKLI